MFGPLGVPEMLMIFFVALIVFGPRKLPELGRTLGKALGEFKKATDELKTTIEREVQIDEQKRLIAQVVQIPPEGSVVSRGEPQPAAAAVTAPPVAAPSETPSGPGIDPSTPARAE
ncbi:MAG: sec-independent protein translocase protein TatA [Acidobacteriota bacterium]|jgi:TatA/E family protein of Tat protein translocase|nr:sec-independent protein translocase protein TatA [Acidobacteriota bacterium]